MTRTAIGGGTSNTCKRDAPISPGADQTRHTPQVRDAPSHPPALTCPNRALGCPGCSPGLRPMRLRSDLGAGLANPSALGGFEEFREFKPSCRPNSAISAAAAVNSESKSAITVSRLASAPSATASCFRSSAADDSSDPSAIINTTARRSSSHAGKDLTSYTWTCCSMTSSIVCCQTIVHGSAPVRNPPPNRSGCPCHRSPTCPVALPRLILLVATSALVPLQGHVKITSCIELVTLGRGLRNEPVPECPAQSRLSPDVTCYR
jgi:hypothetical protein